MSRRAAWLRLAITFLVTVATTLSLGAYAKYAAEPRLIGTSSIGNWTHIDGPRVGVRIDAVTLSDSLPSAFDGSPDEVAGPGLKLATISFSVALADPDWDGLNCWVELFNKNGDRYSKDISGVAGPEVTQCYNVDLAETRPTGKLEPFRAQLVYLVPDVPVADLEVRVMFGENDKDYWRIPAA